LGAAGAVGWHRLQQVLDRQLRDPPHREPRPPARARLDAVGAAAASLQRLEPVQATAAAVGAHLVGAERDAVLEQRGQVHRQAGAVDHQAHLGVQARRARVEVEGADVGPQVVHREGLGMQAGGRAAGEPAVAAGARGGAALHLVEPDAGLQQRAAIPRVAGVHRHHVGGLERVRQHRHLHARRRQPAQHRRATARGHEVGRHQHQLALGPAERRAQALGQQRQAHGVAEALGRVVADQPRGGPLEGEPALQQLADEGAGGQRGQVVLRHRRVLHRVGAALEQLRCVRAGRRQHVVQRVGRGAGPVALEVVGDGPYHLADRQHVEVDEHHLVIGAEVLVADVTAADDADPTIGGVGLVVHAAVQPPEVDQVAQRPPAPLAEGIEQPHLDVGLGLQRGQQRVHALGVVVVEQQPHPHAALGRAVQRLHQQAARGVGAPDVVLHVEGALGGVGDQHPGREGVVAVVQRDDAGLAGMRGDGLADGLREAGVVGVGGRGAVRPAGGRLQAAPGLDQAPRERREALAGRPHPLPQRCAPARCRPPGRTGSDPAVGRVAAWPIPVWLDAHRGVARATAHRATSAGRVAAFPFASPAAATATAGAARTAAGTATRIASTKRRSRAGRCRAGG
jgi:hypothetical protein